ncbi:MAG TPA: hypothetical protein ENF87_01950 [Thermoproteales archaeon]|nr:hypothetical protein [Thermoproteales archaeon]
MKTYFENEDLNYTPIVEVILKNPLGVKVERAKLIVDTGFQGGILITLRTYLNLNLNLFEEGKVVAKIVTGASVKLRVSKAKVEINGAEILCHAYTTLNVKKQLLGREVLKKLGLLYKPPETLKIGLK